MQALCREIECRADGRSLTTVYFGGGTPSQLTTAQLGCVVDTVRRCFDLSGLREATIEANPEDLTQEYVTALAGSGFFNRISIGIQSFCDEELHLLNRAHTAAQARAAVQRAAAAGFGNISIDLIMGLPGQGVADWKANLDAVDSLAPSGAVKHLSCYELTVEPGSILERQLAAGRVAIPDEDVIGAQYAVLQDWCRQRGFEQYEVSNFSLPGYRSLHNSRYWNRTPYIGVGASAHSFDGRSRRWNVPDVAQYIAGAANGVVPYGEETLSESDAYNEYVMTALRTADGIEKALVDERYREHLGKHIVPFVKAGMVCDAGDAYRPTAEGMLHADGMAASRFI